jgi:hypothetical protein
MIGIESRLNRDAATPTEPDLNRLGLLPEPNLAQRLGRLDLHFHELGFFCKRTDFPSSESAAFGLNIASWFRHRK